MIKTQYVTHLQGKKKASKSFFRINRLTNEFTGSKEKGRDKTKDKALNIHFERV